MSDETKVWVLIGVFFLYLISTTIAVSGWYSVIILPSLAYLTYRIGEVEIPDENEEQNNER